MENIPTVASPPLETTPRRWAQTLARYREPNHVRSIVEIDIPAAAQPGDTIRSSASGQLTAKIRNIGFGAKANPMMISLGVYLVSRGPLPARRSSSEHCAAGAPRLIRWRGVFRSQSEEVQTEHIPCACRQGGHAVAGIREFVRHVQNSFLASSIACDLVMPRRPRIE